MRRVTRMNGSRLGAALGATWPGNGRVRRPYLSPTAKAQLWGMCAGGATAFYANYKLGYGIGLFLVGWAIAWAAGEVLLGKRLIGKTDRGAIALGVVSGFAFPWIGFLFSALLEAMRP